MFLSSFSHFQSILLKDTRTAFPEHRSVFLLCLKSSVGFKILQNKPQRPSFFFSSLITHKSSHTWPLPFLNAFLSVCLFVFAHSLFFVWNTLCFTIIFSLPHSHRPEKNSINPSLVSPRHLFVNTSGHLWFCITASGLSILFKPWYTKDAQKIADRCWCIY